MNQPGCPWKLLTGREMVLNKEIQKMTMNTGTDDGNGVVVVVLSYIAPFIT